MDPTLGAINPKRKNKYNQFYGYSKPSTAFRISPAWKIRWLACPSLLKNTWLNQSLNILAGGLEWNIQTIGQLTVGKDWAAKKKIDHNRHASWSWEDSCIYRSTSVARVPSIREERTASRRMNDCVNNRASGLLYARVVSLPNSCSAFDKASTSYLRTRTRTDTVQNFMLCRRVCRKIWPDLTSGCLRS